MQTDDTNYDLMLPIYLGIEADRLNAVLKSAGIADKDQRRQICLAYLSGAAGSLGAGTITVGDPDRNPQLAGRTLRPRLVFQEGETLFALAADMNRGDAYEQAETAVIATPKRPLPLGSPTKPCSPHRHPDTNFLDEKR